MKTEYRFVIMSPGGAAKFLAKDEAEASDISARLLAGGLKNEILHLEAAKDRDVHGVNRLLMLERSKNKPANKYRYDWANGRALVSFRGKCIAEANWDVGAPNPKEFAAKNGQLIADALNAYNEHAALVAVAEAASGFIRRDKRFLEHVLAERLDALTALRQQQGSEVAK